MLVAFGSWGEPDLIGALSVPRSLAPRNGGGGAAAFWARAVSSSRDFLGRATASPRNRKSTFADGFARLVAIGGEGEKIRTDFGGVADVVGLTNDERAALIGGSCELSRIILALEMLGAAFDLFGAPADVIAWLRDKNPDEPFNHRSPLQWMAAEGRLGAEITLLYLRARMRRAPQGGETSGGVLPRRRQG